MADLIKAKVKETRKYRVHNTLSQAAWHFKQVIEDKQKNGGTGITYDCMACATMLAFTWEAYLNFFGDELIGEEARLNTLAPIQRTPGYG
jgi:hypothetical protein